MARIISLLTALPLLLFSLRRLVFTLTALLTPPPAEDARDTPADDDPPFHGDPPFYNLLVLVPCRNDGANLPGLTQSLTTNGYPAAHLRILLIDDGSSDDSATIATKLAEAHSPIQTLCLPQNVGKAAALNAGLAFEPWGDIVAVYDADHRPEAGGLTTLAAAFSDPQVGAVSARTAPRNALDSPSAYYSAVERLVHQRITMVAKDRLHLAPAILGSHCAYRRNLLTQLGGFQPGAFLEDSDLTVRIAAAGYRTRYLETIPAWDETPATLTGYWRQHVRWGRGFQDVAVKRRNVLFEPDLSPALRLELFLFSLGYLDRLALLLAAALVVADAVLKTRFRFPKRFLLAVAILPYVQVVAALARTRAGIDWWLRLPYLFLLFPVDVAAALRSAIDTVLNRPRQWRQTSRMPSGESQIFQSHHQH